MVRWNLFIEKKKIIGKIPVDIESEPNLLNGWSCKYRLFPKKPRSVVDDLLANWNKQKKCTHSS